jgi:hypothetical protein
MCSYAVSCANPAILQSMALAQSAYGAGSQSGSSDSHVLSTLTPNLSPAASRTIVMRVLA